MGYRGTWMDKEGWLDWMAKSAWGDPSLSEGENEWNFLAAILDPRLSHIRPRRMAGAGEYHACVYFREPSSPTGVLLATSCLYYPEAEPIIRRFGNTRYTLSPTEPR